MGDLGTLNLNGSSVLPAANSLLVPNMKKDMNSSSNAGGGGVGGNMNALNDLLGSGLTSGFGVCVGPTPMVANELGMVNMTEATASGTETDPTDHPSPSLSSEKQVSASTLQDSSSSGSVKDPTDHPSPSLSSEKQASPSTRQDSSSSSRESRPRLKAWPLSLSAEFYNPLHCSNCKG